MKKLLIYLTLLLGLINCENISYKNRLCITNLNDDEKNEAIFLNKEIGLNPKYTLWLYTEKQTKHFSKKQKLMELENYKPGNFIESYFENCNKDSLIDIIIKTKFENESLRKYLFLNQSDLTKKGHLKFGSPLELSVLPEPISYKNANKTNLYGF